MKTKHKPKRTKWNGDRIVGCKSTNHMACKGELWECKRCHKITCWEEGYADEHLDLCDDCWYDIVILEHEFSIGVVSTWVLKYEN